jgi:hypothetical protein
MKTLTLRPKPTLNPNPTSQTMKTLTLRPKPTLNLEPESGLFESLLEHPPEETRCRRQQQHQQHQQRVRPVPPHTLQAETRHLAMLDPPRRPVKMEDRRRHPGLGRHRRPWPSRYALCGY